jgi:RNA-directed DNA polymerase
MSLETPIKIRMLQRKLYQKAKEEPDYRFYLLYDKIYREDILNHAYALAKSNQGAPGVDGQSFAGIEAAGLEEWLNGIRNDLRAKTYTPQAVRRVKIPKPGGGERPLVTPTVQGAPGSNRHVVGDERALQERRKRIHSGPEPCGEHREVLVEA